MSDGCRRLIIEGIRERGPMTFDTFMEIALYHPQHGYYARAPQRSGRAGDFYTSVDVGPLFGELLAERFSALLTGAGLTGVRDRHHPPDPRPPIPDRVDLVEGAAGNGRLSCDVLDALERINPALYDRVCLQMVERSAAARDAQPLTLAHHASKLSASRSDLPQVFSGILFANELLDALPTHVIVSREDGLHEVYVDVADTGLVEREGPLSTPAIAEHLRALRVRLEPGWRAEVNLEAVRWTCHAARALRRGFLVLVDYGHEAATLYSASHAAGTLATYRRHTVEVGDSSRQPPWLAEPGSRDITSHVDFTSVRRAAEREGLVLVGFADQTHFLLACDIERLLATSAGAASQDLNRRLALKTLLMPGGLGSTLRVMVLGRPSPAL